MPVDFLTQEQESKYGKYNEEPLPEQLSKYFWLDDNDRIAAFSHKGDHNCLSFALQLGTVRYLGTFVTDFSDIPTTVINFVARQLRIQITDLTQYGNTINNKTFRLHTQEIRQIYSYHDFSEQPFHFRLIRWLYTRAWISAERPSVMFDLATARCVENKILLPGVTIMTRLIAKVRDRASIRLWHKLAKLPNDNQRIMLEKLLDTELGSRSTPLDILRQPPTSATSKGLILAIDRLERLRSLGAVEWNISDIPVNRIRVLSRYASMARAQTIERMNYDRRIATLVSFAIVFTISAQDDVIEIMEIIFTDTFRKSDNKGKKNRIRTIKDLDLAARRLREVCSLLLDENISDSELRKVIFAKHPKDVLESSLQMVDRLTKLPDMSVAHEELFRNYTNIRKFLPSLMASLEFQATPSGQQALLSWNFLAASENKTGKNKYANAPLNGLCTAWRKLVLKNPGDKINPCAYTFWTIERMNESLKRHDIYIEKSERYCDPRAQLLQGDAWESVKPHVLRTLDWSSCSTEALQPLVDDLDRTYKNAAKRWDSNTSVRMENDRLILSPLDKLEEPKSLKKLRKQVQSLLPHTDLPEIVLELNGWVPFLNAFTHISESNSRVNDLPISICAVLISQACNIGLEPVVQSGIPALEYDRLIWVEQNYFRTETITQANNALVAYHSKLELTQILGSGEVASADGLRFVTPSKTTNSGPNPKYFGIGRGVTYYNFTSDQFTGLHGIVIPGTIRDSLYLLQLVLEQQTQLQPKEIMTDTAGYSDIVFGLFGLLGYQFSPRLADIGSSKFWRIDFSADYGVLNALSKNRINKDLIIRYWDDFMRVSGSLMLGTVNPTQLIKALQHGGKPTMLGKAIGELGRIFKTKHNLTYIDDEAYRRKILTQLNRGESRHSLARALWYGKKGELHQNYREGQEDQLGALGLMVNAIVIWNTRYMGLVLDTIRDKGKILEYEDVQRLSPLGYDHVNIVGKYSFNLPETIANGELRPLVNEEDANYK
jgi:TnpA family transposase